MSPTQRRRPRTRRADDGTAGAFELKFTVVGAGAIGGTIGAFMVRGGEEVEFVDNASDHVAVMRVQGLSVEGARGSFTVPVVACLVKALDAQ